MSVDCYEVCTDDEVVEDEYDGFMVMPEDAACYVPCGEEPYGCLSCPERGRTYDPSEDW